MRHALLRFKDIVFDVNPSKIEMRGEKKLYQAGGLYGREKTAVLGSAPAIIKGSGAFTAEDRAEKCAALQRTFQKGEAGTLLVSDLPPMTAAISELAVYEKSGSPDIFYDVTFCEITPDAPCENEKKYAVCRKGESLWHIGARLGISAERLLELNPSLRDAWNVNEGDEIRTA